VGVQSDRVVIAVGACPDASTWLAVHDLLGCLLDPLASPPGPTPAHHDYTGWQRIYQVTAAARQYEPVPCWPLSQTVIGDTDDWLIEELTALAVPIAA